MKQITLFLSGTFKRHAQKIVLSLLLVAGLYSQVATAQDRRQGGERNAAPNRQNSVHQNTSRNNEVRPMTRPANTSINRTNNNINRTNTPINRPPVNRTNTTINRTNTTINRTSGNRNYNSNRTVNNRVTVNRTVNNNYRAPAYNARNPNWRYSNMPRRNSVRISVPVSYRTINYGGYGYRYHNGIFYRPYNNSFIVTAPPIGLFIDVLPIGYRRVYVNNYPYYYTVDGAQYKPVVQDNGEIWYEVIKAN